MRQAAERFFCGAARSAEIAMNITIRIPAQSLELFDDSGKLLHRYPVSTGANGAGEENGSFCTPRGRHVVRAKIGAGQPVNAVFAERRPTGEVYTPELGAKQPGRDWILTRILWLSGCERGYNRMGSCDTMRRYIYIHGTPDSTELGRPGSKGCVRMRNADLLELFDLAPAGTQVEIIA
jgi:lipoprotein-anchoring transpeptidase ErfK/SrfK